VFAEYDIHVLKMVLQKDNERGIHDRADLHEQIKDEADRSRVVATK
jgi:hypothetical protein